ncbi:GIY-YIG nuclease family protein [Thermodesulfobacteriota bacterium]
MKFERSKVEFPLWRKKVDSSLFDHKGTTIPTWACDMWGIQPIFKKCVSKKDKASQVIITFNKKKYSGLVTIASKGRKTPAYRLWFDDDLCFELKQTFLMSHMRSLEKSLNKDQSATDIETRIPFWEFLDIEFDSDKREFKFVAYYKQEPSFPELFKRLIGSPALQKVDDEIRKGEKDRVYKQDWKRKEDLEFEIGAKNVIYYLADTDRKLLYVGEAKDLVKRLSQKYPAIPHWNHFRYDVLPQNLDRHRVTIERMLIRDMACLIGNKYKIGSLGISEYTLVNDKIDKN